MGFSSDGDSKLMKCMKQNTNFTIQRNMKILGEKDFACIQDYVHIGTKLRNRLLKPGIILPMGNKLVTASHLKMLINNVAKGSHGLVLKDICPDDRQNYRSLEKVMQHRVSETLTANIIDSEATLMYIRLCSEVTSCIGDYTLSPENRIQKIWHVTYFLRCWRKWLKNQRNYKLSKNFISENAYYSIEINAHNIVKILQILKYQKRPDLFKPVLFSSQPCEEIFRRVRSMSTMNWTRINFTLLELLHIIHRVELLNDIVYSKLASSDVFFPRIENKKQTYIEFELPTDESINDVIKSAKDEALNDAKNLGMHVNDSDINKCECFIPNLNFDDIVEENESSDEDNDMNENWFSETNHLFDFSSLKEYESDLNEICPFIEVPSKSGGLKTVRKSSVVWLLSDTRENLSSDRLRRVQNTTKSKSCQRRLEFSQINSSLQNHFVTLEELQIGNWCICKYKSTSTDNPIILFGAVLSFRYINGETEKKKNYTWDFAKVSSSNEREIEVLSSWYQLDSNEKLYQTYSFYINIKSYVATLLNPSLENINNQEKPCIFFSKECLIKITQKMSEIKKNKS